MREMLVNFVLRNLIEFRELGLSFFVYYRCKAMRSVGSLNLIVLCVLNQI